MGTVPASSKSKELTAEWNGNGAWICRDFEDGEGLSICGAVGSSQIKKLLDAITKLPSLPESGCSVNLSGTTYQIHHFRGGMCDPFGKCRYFVLSVSIIPSGVMIPKHVLEQTT